MKESYSRFMEDHLWIIKETEWDKGIQAIRETQFALGNGYIGSRAVMEEIPYDARPGTYITGIYDKLTAQVSEMVNFPNPVNFKFTVTGEKIGVSAMEVLSHKRVLNMKKGLLLRNTRYRNSKGDRFDYQSLRFISMHNKNIGAMQIVLTPLDKDYSVDVETNIDTSVYNAGSVTEGRKKHFRVRELGQKSNAGYLSVETFAKKYALVYWSGFYYEYEGKKTYAKDNIFRIRVKKRKPIVFTKIFYIEDVPADKAIPKHREAAFKKFYKAFHSKFDTLLNEHIQAWAKLWEASDIVIKGVANILINMRFNIYHMLICGYFDNGVSSIGARTLSGEGYRGHIFWDTEIFLLPFYVHTNPRVARNMLLYRYKRLDQARTIAKEAGYKGAMFPWESAGSGFDDTPTWAKDINGEIVKIFTNKMEQHITSDIAFAVRSYYNATDDEEFMKDYGCEIMFETARFCASRAEYNKKKDIYEINHVIGPDEFHIDVNNNAFTNTMAVWNLLAAYRIFNDLKKKSPKVYSSLKKKIHLKDSEVGHWKTVAAKMKKSNTNRKGVIEQFDGYFKLKKAGFKEVDENGIPVLPKNLSTVDMGKTQLIKQPDVIIMLYLLSDFFTFEQVKENYRFYMIKTAHKSSLSPAISALMACRAGDIFRAYHFFNVTLRADISNLYGNTYEGAHAASLGGTYQALIFGFAGLKKSEKGLMVDPRLPRTWEKLVFPFHWKGQTLEFEVDNSEVKIKAKSRKKKGFNIIVFGKKQLIKGSKTYTFTRETKPPVGKFFFY